MSDQGAAGGEERRRYDSGTPFEPVAGYSRAVRIGRHVWVAGTTATDERGEIVAPGDAYGQTVQIFKNIRRALNALDADFQHVVRTRMFVTNIDDFEAIGRAHREVFGDIRPVATMVEVSRFVRPEMLIEIEVDAYV